MKNPRVTGQNGWGQPIRMDAVKRDDGSLSDGYIRLESHDGQYLGWFDARKLLRFADTLRRRDAKRRNRP